MTQIELDPTLLATLQTLESHAVEYVLVGEVADAVHNRGGFVLSVAVVPAAYGRNVDRLAVALEALDAQLSDGQPMDPRTTDLRACAPCRFTTAHASVELDFAPGGKHGYRELFADAARTHLAPGVNPHVASPQDLERLAGWARDGHDTPPAVPQAMLPEPEYWDPPAPAAADEIRASRATRR